MKSKTYKIRDFLNIYYLTMIRYDVAFANGIDKWIYDEKAMHRSFNYQMGKTRARNSVFARLNPENVTEKLLEATINRISSYDTTKVNLNRITNWQALKNAFFGDGTVPAADYARVYDICQVYAMKVSQYCQETGRVFNKEEVIDTFKTAIGVDANALDIKRGMFHEYMFKCRVKDSADKELVAAGLNYAWTTFFALLKRNPETNTLEPVEKTNTRKETEAVSNKTDEQGVLIWDIIPEFKKACEANYINQYSMKITKDTPYWCVQSGMMRVAVVKLGLDSREIGRKIDNRTWRLSLEQVKKIEFIYHEQCKSSTSKSLRLRFLNRYKIWHDVRRNVFHDYEDIEELLSIIEQDKEKQLPEGKEQEAQQIVKNAESKLSDIDDTERTFRKVFINLAQGLGAICEKHKPDANLMEVLFKNVQYNSSKVSEVTAENEQLRRQVEGLIEANKKSYDKLHRIEQLVGKTTI